MLGVQAKAGHLDEDSFQACFNHIRQKLALVSLPQIAQGSEA